MGRNNGGAMSIISKKTSNKIEFTYDEFMTWRMPEPYDCVIPTDLHEVEAPDGSVLFLVLFGRFNDDTMLVTHYAIEAPRHCLMREAFEWGDISWVEYWTHRSHLMFIEHPFDPGPVTTRIITPAQIDARTLQRLKNLGDKSPYELKREHLERCLKNTTWNGKCPVKADRKYSEFMARHATKLRMKAA